MKAIITILSLVCCWFPGPATAQTCGVITCRNRIVCRDTASFPLQQCEPPGGKYSCETSPPAVDQNWFLPGFAKPGPNLVRYIFNHDTCFFSIVVVSADTAGAIAGPNRICKGETGRFTIKSLPNDTAYEWSFPNAGFFKVTPDTAAGVLFPPGSISGYLTVRGINACGKGTASSLYVSVEDLPDARIVRREDTVAVADTVCMNAEVTYLLSGNTSSDSIHWTAHLGKVTGNAGEPVATVRWGNLPGIDSLSAWLRNPSGCTRSVFRRVVIRDQHAPSPSTIWQFGCNMLVCSDSLAGCYQWFRNGLPFGGVVAPSGRYILDTLNRSTYTVLTCSDQTACSCCNLSASYQPLKTGCDDGETCMQVSPNPANGIIVVTVTGKPDPEGRILVFNRLGSLVRKERIPLGSLTVDLSALPPGICFIEFMGINGTRLTSRIVKL